MGAYILVDEIRETHEKVSDGAEQKTWESAVVESGYLLLGLREDWPEEVTSSSNLLYSNCGPCWVQEEGHSWQSTVWAKVLNIGNQF